MGLLFEIYKSSSGLQTVVQSTNFDLSIGESRELSAHELEINDISRGFDVSNKRISEGSLYHQAGSVCGAP